jgi:hypothetical protein
MTMMHHNRRNDFDLPPDKEVGDMTLDEFTLDMGQPPKDESYCDPVFAADELLRSFEPMLLESMRPIQAAAVVRHRFVKNGVKVAFSHKSQIAVRLSYVPDRSRGLRILAFSHPIEHRRRLVSGYDKKLDKTLLRKDRSLEKKFFDHSMSLGFKVTLHSQGEGLIMAAVGSYHTGICLCRTVVELAISTTTVGEKGRPMFRHILHNPLART